jgi:hypothetical protein
MLISVRLGLSVFVRALASVLTVAASARNAEAEIAASDLIRIQPLAATLALEGTAADAIRRKDNKALARIASDIRKSDTKLLAEASVAIRSRRIADSPDGVGLTACHYAGLTLRLAIVGFADGSIMPRIKGDLIDAIPPDRTDQFAAHMQRCELLERVEPSARKIGSSCLIDGKGCRESER